MSYYLKKCWLLLIFVPLVTHAGSLYKSIGPDGGVVYSDQPPTTGKIEKTFTYTNLPATPLPESVIRYRDELQNSMKARLTGADKSSVSSGPVLFTAAWCGYCRHAKAYLNEKSISFKEHDIDTPSGMSAFAAAEGGKGIPLLVLNGKKISGFSKASYDALFSATR